MKLFAFWEYDLYPYLLGAEIVEMLDSGRVKAKGYDGMIFTPVLIVPVATGRKIREKLQRLKDRYRKKSKELEELFVKKAQDAIKDHAAVIPAP